MVPRFGWWLKMRQGFKDTTFDRMGRSILDAGTAVKRPFNRSGEPIFQICAGVSEWATAGYDRAGILHGSASDLNARRICASLGISGHAALTS
jgi:hypothetical protein